jgi:hypothetical protein
MAWHIRNLPLCVTTFGADSSTCTLRQLSISYLSTNGTEGAPAAAWQIRGQETERRATASSNSLLTTPDRLCFYRTLLSGFSGLLWNPAANSEAHPGFQDSRIWSTVGVKPDPGTAPETKHHNISDDAGSLNPCSTSRSFPSSSMLLSSGPQARRPSGATVRC